MSIEVGVLPPEHEALGESPQQLLDAALSDFAFNSQLTAIDSELDDHIMRRISIVHERIDANNDKADAVGEDNDDSRAMYTASHDLESRAKKSYGTKAWYRHSDLSMDRKRIENGEMLLRGSSASELMNGILGNAVNIEPQEMPAHVDSSTMQSIKGRVDDSRKALLILENGDTVTVPTSMFVAAEGFDSWQGRGVNGSANNKGYTSAESITYQATREGGPEPINQASAFVLPDGRVLFSSDNAHRLGGAVQRGDETVTLDGSIRVYELDRTPYAFRNDNLFPVISNETQIENNTDSERALGAVLVGSALR